MRKGGQKKKSKLKILLVLVIVLAVIVCIIAGAIFAKPYIEEYIYKLTSIENATTIEGEKLVFKSSMEDKRIVQYTFKDGQVHSIKINEAFNDKAKFEQAKERYNDASKYKILFTDEINFRLEIKKLDLEVDKGLTYEQVAEKYLVQIIGAYEIIK